MAHHYAVQLRREISELAVLEAFIQSLPLSQSQSKQPASASGAAAASVSASSAGAVVEGRQDKDKLRAAGACSTYKCYGLLRI